MTATLYQILTFVQACIAAITFTADNSSATEYKLRDRPSVNSEHLGVTVLAPESVDADLTGGSKVWIYDTVQVVLTISVPRTMGQLEQIRIATEHEERIRLAMNTYTDLLAHQPVWQDTKRDTTEPGWLTITQSYRIRRFEERS